MVKKTLLIISLALLSLSCANAKIVSTSDIDWQSFLSQHDLVWDSIAPNYYTGAILGNGLLGTNIYKDHPKNQYRWDIGRVDVNEARKGDQVLFDKARLPIGYFTLATQGEVDSEQMRLSLWDATAKGTIETDRGTIDFKTFVHAQHNIIHIEIDTKGEENNIQWNWNPEEAISPRAKMKASYIIIPDEYIKNPNPKVDVRSDGNIKLSVQKLYSGKVYVTAWHINKTANKQKITVTVSFENSEEKAIQVAQQTIENYLTKDTQKHEKEHQHWWHTYYPQSFVSFEDARVESFYWIQQYKFACLTRQNGHIIDLQGPWTNKTPWPAIWWNLNIQLTYSPLFTANRLELSAPLWHSLNNNIAQLINNVPQEEWRIDAAAIARSSAHDLASPLRTDLVDANQYEVGNLTWVLLYYYQYCTYKADTKELIERFFPLLKRSIAYYEHILYKAQDGKWHLPKTASPEYKPAEDCNYDLALLRWGIQTLLKINKEQGLKDTKQANWENILTSLVDYPADADGYLIGKDVKLESSHRHYSHLMMIYPLNLVSWDNEQNRDIITKSMNHWLGMKGALQGYTFTGAASMYAQQGDGDKAISNLNQLLDKYIQPNTLYRESGPVIETPFSAATSLQELYLQSTDEDIRVFPALPSTWKDASFINMRAVGGFLISALYANGKTQMVQIEATVDNTASVKTDMVFENSHITTLKGNKIDYTQQDNKLAVAMKKGDILLIADKDYAGRSDFLIAHPNNEINSYGLKKKTKTQN